VLIPSLTALDHRLTSIPLEQSLNGSADVIVLANRQGERAAVPTDQPTRTVLLYLGNTA
jgi:hypothetical protein